MVVKSAQKLLDEAKNAAAKTKAMRDLQTLHLQFADKKYPFPGKAYEPLLHDSPI